MTRRRKPFRQPPDGPTRERDPERVANDVDDSQSDSAGDSPSASAFSGASASQGRGVPTRERQTAEHQFKDEELAPPPFPTSFSKAANVHVDPVVHAQLHTASPDRPSSDTDPEDNPLIMMLRDHDDLDAAANADRAEAKDLDDFDLKWKLELPSEDPEDRADTDGGGENSADFAFGDDAAPAVNQAPGDEDGVGEDGGYDTSEYDASHYRNLDAGSAGFVDDDRELSYASDAAAQIDFLRAEVRRYQGDLERERLARTTAITAAQLAADARVEDLIRSQRHEREQLDLINRQLLDAQRSEAEARRSALIEEHRRQRAKEHQQYQERIAALRESTRNISQAASERFENEHAEAHATRVRALQSQLDDATERAEQAETDSRDLRSRQHTWEQQLSDAESSLAEAQTRQRDTSAQLTRQVQELQERLARAEQRLNGERKRTSEVVGNLLRESAAVASQARNTDQEITSLRASWADERDAVVTATLAEARAIERAAAEREAHLEATIGQLRAALHGVDSSTRGA